MGLCGREHRGIMHNGARSLDTCLSCLFPMQAVPVTCSLALAPPPSLPPPKVGGAAMFATVDNPPEQGR